MAFTTSVPGNRSASGFSRPGSGFSQRPAGPQGEYLTKTGANLQLRLNSGLPGAPAIVPCEPPLDAREAQRLPSVGSGAAEGLFRFGSRITKRLQALYAGRRGPAVRPARGRAESEY